MSLSTPEDTIANPANEAAIQQQRRLIYDLVAQDKFDEIGKLPGFRIVRKSDTFQGMPVNCIMYVFGLRKYGNKEVIDQEGFAEEMARRFIKESPEVPIAQPGDVVVYGSERDPLMHVGKVIDPKTVESKFGRFSHVFQHPIGVVSSAYGDQIRIYRPSESTQKLLP